MIAIFKREFKSYFNTFIGPLVIGGILMVMFLYFIFTNILSESAILTNTLYVTAFFALSFAIPILCMRCFAEERRSKTDQLILTAPIAVGKVVLGKFMALAAIYAIPCAVAAMLPLVLALFGTPEYAWSYTSVLALFLYGLMAIAICMFISSLTENQIISTVGGIFFLLLGCLLGSAYSSISITWLQTFLKSTYDFSSRLDNMMNGSFDFTSVIYFVSVTALFLFLCTQSIQKRRYSVSKKNFSIGAYSFAMSIIMIVVVVFANLAAEQIPDSIKAIDVTSSGLTSISTDSKEVAAGITDDITIYFLAKEGDDDSNKDQNLEKIIKLYTEQNSKITLKYVDPIVNPQFGSTYTDSTLSYNSVVVENTTNSRAKAISYSDMLSYSYDQSTYQSSITGYDYEGQITSALQYVSLDEDQLLTAYTTTGHNEASFDSTFSDVFSKYSMTTSDLNLLTTDSVPDDCDLLIINEPTTDFTEEEASRVIDYLDNGGNILIDTTYAETDEMINFDTILSYYGVTKESGMIIETDPNMYYYSTQQSVPYYLYPSFGDDDIVSSLSSDGAGFVFAPYAQALSYDASSTDYTYAALLTSSEGAYLKKDLTGSLEQTSDDITGQYTLGLKTIKTVDGGDGESIGVIYTASQMFTDSANSMVNGINVKLFGNTINALVDLQVDYVTIPVKSTDLYITVTSQNVRVIVSACVALVLAIWIFGLALWIVRRHK